MATWRRAKKIKDTTIHNAVFAKDINALKHLLTRKSVNVNAVNAKGATALHVAVVLEDLDALRALLAHPDIDPNAQEPNGKTALHLAVSAGSPSAIEALLEHPRTNVNLADRAGRSPLHCAVSAVSMVEDTPYDPSDFESDPWHDAISTPENNPDSASGFASELWTAATLLARAPGVNHGAQDKGQRTPLSWALHLGLSDLALTLIGDREVVSEVAVTDIDGNTALHKAVACCEKLVPRVLSGQSKTVLNAKNNQSETALHVAARSNAAASLELLVNAGADLDERRDWDDATPFHIAVQNNSYKFVRRLSSLHPTQRNLILSKNKDGNTPLHLAAEQGNTHMVEIIIAQYADIPSDSASRPGPVKVTQMNNKGETAVELAAALGHISTTFKLLINASIELELDRSIHREAAFRILPRLLDTSTGSVETRNGRVGELLEWAARFGVLDVLQALQQHADPYMLERLIVLAAEGGHVHVVQYLVEAGVDPNAPKSSRSSLAAAAGHGHVEVMRFLLSLDRVDPNGYNHEPFNFGRNRDTPLMCAIEARSAAAVSLLLNEELLQSGRLDMNMGDSGSEETGRWHLNPLTMACWFGYDDMANMLVRRTYLERGWLTLHVSDEKNGTGPLGLACERGHWRVADVLLQARFWSSGLDALRVDAKDDLGRSPFSYACSSCSPDTVDLFLKTGLIKDGLVNPDSTDKDGMTPFAYACRSSGIGVVELILDSYLLRDGLVNPDSTDNDGMTPLAHACKRGSIGVVKLIFDSYLLRGGLVNPNARDKSGLTPLAHACRWGWGEIIELFLDYFLCDDSIAEVDFGTVDESGKTLLDLAFNVPDGTLEENRIIRTILALLDSRLIDRGLTDLLKASSHIFHKVFRAYLDSGAEGVQKSFLWPAVRRLAELRCPLKIDEHVFWCGVEPE